MTRTRPDPEVVLCVRNDGYPTSLEVRKVYQAVPDAAVAARGHVRVNDEAGEDYLYPESFFVPIKLPQAAARAFAQAS